MKLRGTVYRAHNPRWTFPPTSGEGAARYGGCFNPLGVPALNTSRRMETAWIEAQQGFAFKAQPLTVCAYAVDCDGVADRTDPATCATLGVNSDAGYGMTRIRSGRCRGCRRHHRTATSPGATPAP